MAASPTAFVSARPDVSSLTVTQSLDPQVPIIHVPAAGWAPMTPDLPWCSLTYLQTHPPQQAEKGTDGFNNQPASINRQHMSWKILSNGVLVSGNSRVADLAVRLGSCSGVYALEAFFIEGRSQLA